MISSVQKFIGTWTVKLRSMEMGMLSNLGLLACIIQLGMSQSLMESLNIPESHLPFYFGLFPEALQRCQQDPSCYEKNVTVVRCWGYEEHCAVTQSFLSPVCEGDHRGWVRSKEEQLSVYYAQADFGYVKSHRDSLQTMCDPTFLDDSALECSDHLQFCRGRHIMLNLTNLASTGTWRYRMDVLQPGDIRGFCNIHDNRLHSRSDHMSPLQSWAAELKNFRTLPRSLNLEDCDIYFEKPTIIMKIDAAVNMYHHFCDFFNLYASLHVNATHHAAFSDDVHIIIWETFPYRSAFKDAWKVFTRHPVQTVDTFAGKTICFRNLMLPLLPRMIFGLYYNTPLVYGCEKSGLFKAFSEHFLHRMKIPDPIKEQVINITWLSRETSYRNVLNERELLEAAGNEEGVEVRRVVFDSRMPFTEQLKTIRSTDIFIGMHGAGLTHLLFLPDWAAVFELYNCEDENCYLDLARLRGVKYTTWEKREKLKEHGTDNPYDSGSHAKFMDYSFDVSEFLRLLRKLVAHVRSRKNPSAHHDEL